MTLSGSGTFADTTPPDTIITSSPPNPTSSTSFSFSFTASEADSTFECSLRGGVWGACTSPYADSIVYAQCTTCRTDTPVNFAVRAKDPAHNIDPTPASYAWVIRNSVGSLLDYVIDGGVVQLNATDYYGDVILSRGVAFTLIGGYDTAYITSSGKTIIHGTVTILAGAVIIDNIVIR